MVFAALLNAVMKLFSAELIPDWLSRDTVSVVPVVLSFNKVSETLGMALVIVLLSLVMGRPLMLTEAEEAVCCEIQLFGVPTL